MAMTSSLKTYYINILNGKKYPIIFGENAFEAIDKKDTAGATKALIVTNRTISSACNLFIKYEIVLAMDIDEFLTVDPFQKISLKDYLSRDFKSSSLSALGLDVGQHPSIEKPIDLSKPFLSQRAFAQVSDRYTKPIITFKPLQWGSGFHRIKWKNFTIDNNLFLFHFGLVDLANAKKNIQNKQLLSLGWKGHFDRRFQLYEIIKTQNAQEGDYFFKKARIFFATKRKWYAWNKPAPLKENALVRIPKRFENLV